MIMRDDGRLKGVRHPAVGHNWPWRWRAVWGCSSANASCRCLPPPRVQPADLCDQSQGWRGGSRRSHNSAHYRPDGWGEDSRVRRPGGWGWRREGREWTWHERWRTGDAGLHQGKWVKIGSSSWARESATDGAEMDVEGDGRALR